MKNILIFVLQKNLLLSYTKSILMIFLGSFILLNTSQLYANVSFWSETTFLQRSSSGKTFDLMPNHYSLYQLDEVGIRNYLSNSARSRTNSKTLAIPLPNRQMMKLTLTETSVMAPQLAAKYPQIKTYQASVAGRPDIYGVVDVNELGFHGMLFMEDGRRLFIDPRQLEGKTYYISYYDDDYHPTDKQKPQCSIDLLPITQHSAKRDASNFSTKKPLARTGANLRTYRLAMAATGEYTAHHGGTVPNALSAIATTVARVNQIYERDLAVKLELIANNDQIIFIDASTDPYTNNENNMQLLNENSAAINTAIGSSTNYDIGHVVTKNTGGGVATLGSVCSTQKAEAMTGHPTPQNDPFDIDFLAHELGHQFGANHSFNAIAGECNRNPLDNSTPSTAWEIGNGATIMSYAGICDSANDVVTNSIAMFHTGSIREMSQFIDNNSGGSSCGTASTLNNQQPTANAGSDYTIPSQTPFQLVGVGSDADSSDTLSYSWEQMDLGNIANIADGDTGNNPLFRIFAPNSNSNRTFPQLTHILSNTQSIGEILPTTNRSLIFAFTVRDQKGGVADDEMTITVINTSTPFKITSHTANSSLVAGSSTNIAWDIGETNQAPISCANVDISLSVDGGNTFPTFLVQNSVNDGSETVVIPASTTANTTTRFKVACSDNIFFDISDSDLTITSSVTPSAVELTGQVTLPNGMALIPENACLDTNQTPAITVATCRRVSITLMKGSTVLGTTTVNVNGGYTLPFTEPLPVDAYLKISTKFTDALVEEQYYYDFGADKSVGGATTETNDVFVPLVGVSFDTNGIPTNVNPLTISATPTTVDLDVSALPSTTSTTTNVELTGQVTLPNNMALIPENACLDTNQTPAITVATCRRVSITLMKGSTVLGTTTVNVDGGYTLPFTEPLPVDAYLKISTKFTDALVEEQYYYNFGSDHAIGGATTETTDVFVPVADVTLDGNGIPTNIDYLTIGATPTMLNLDLSNLGSTTANEYLIEGTITVESGFVLGNGIPVTTTTGVGTNGFLSITAIDTKTSTHYRSEITGAAVSANIYPFKLSLPKSTEVKDYIIRIEKFSDNNGAPEFLETYLHDGGDHQFNGNQADSLKSVVGVEWKEIANSGVWIPDTSKTGYFTIATDAVDIQNYSIDLTTFGSGFYKIAGAVTLPSGFDLSDSSNHMNINVMDAATGYYLGSSPVICETTTDCTYSIILGDSLNANGYIVRINQDHWDNTNWDNSWYKGFYLDFGIDNAVGGSDTAADIIKDENDIGLKEVSGYFIPDVNKVVIPTNTAISAVPAIDINFASYIVPTISQISGKIFGIPPTANGVSIHLQNVKNSVGRDVNLNTDGSFTVEDVKEGKYILELRYDIDNNGTPTYYHYILADNDGDFSAGTSVIDGADVNWVPYDNNGDLMGDTFKADFNWDSVAYWAPEETASQKVILNVATSDITIADITIAQPTFYDLTVNLTSVESGKNIYVSLFVPNKPIGRWESITPSSTTANITLKDLKSRTDYQLQFWIEGLGEFWYNGSTGNLLSNVTWVGKQDGSICEDWKSSISTCDFNKEVIWEPNIAGFTINATATLDLSIPNDRKKITAKFALGAAYAGKSVDVNVWQYSGSNYAWEQFIADVSGNVDVALSVLAGREYRMEAYIPSTFEGFVVDLGANNAVGGSTTDTDSLITQQNSWINQHPWGPKTSTLIDATNDVDLGSLNPPSLNTLTFTVENLDNDEQIFISLEGLESNNESNGEWYGRDNVDWAVQPLTYASQITIKVPNNANGYRVMIHPQNHQGGVINNGNTTPNDTIDPNATVSSFSWEWDKADKITVSGDQAYIIKLPSTDSLKSVTGTVSGITGGDMTGWIEAHSPTVGGNWVEVDTSGNFTIQGLNAASDYTLEYQSNLHPNEVIKQTVDITDNVTALALTKSATIHTFSGTVTNVSAGSSSISVLLLDVDHTQGSSDTTIDAGDTWEVISSIDAGTLANAGTYDYSVTNPPPLTGHSYAVAVGSKIVSSTTGKTTFTLFEASIDSDNANTAANTSAVVIDGINNSTNSVSITVQETIAN